MEAKEIRVSYKKVLLINQLNFILEQLTENYKTQIEDPYYSHLLQQIDKSKQPLVSNLIHNLTKLNRLYRVETNQRMIISSEEDVIIALNLTKEFINPESILEVKDREYLRLLENRYLSESFKARQASELFKLQKTQTWKILIKLVCIGYLERSGHKNKGYWYKFPVEPLDFPL